MARAFAETLSYVLILMFSMGVPGILIIVLHLKSKATRAKFETPEMEHIARRFMAELQHDSMAEVKEVIVDLRLGSRFGGLISAFRPGMIMMEGLDMMRKLLLVGFLTVIELGTTSQVVVGLALSFFFFGIHLRLMPYRHIEDNVLRATIETHLFIVMAMVLTLRSDLSGERWGVETYDMVATVLFVLFVPVAMACTIVYKWRQVVEDDMDDKENKRYMQSIQAAFKRHRTGRDKDEDRQLLSEYLTLIEDEVATKFHVFISYRVASEKALALQLYNALSAMTLEETGQQLRVFLDQVNLEDGRRWDAGFMQGLASSWIVVPVLSTAAIAQMQGLDDELEQPDNVLLEWLGALELHARGHVKAIMPLICAGPGGERFNFSLPEQLPKVAHEPTNTAATKHLRQHATSKGIADDKMLSGAARMIADVVRAAPVDAEQAAACSPSAILTTILRFQGAQVDERNDEASLGLGRIVALYYRSSTLYQIH